MAPALAPGIGGAEWEAGVWSRVVLFWDFSGRWAGVQKVRGRNVRPLDPVGDPGIVIVPYSIAAKTGALEEVRFDNATQWDEAATGGKQSERSATATVAAARKRAYDEVADSDDGEEGAAGLDEYGWHELDDELAAADATGDADEVIEVAPPDEAVGATKRTS